MRKDEKRFSLSLQCDPFIAQKERMTVYKFISDCLDMIDT